MTSTTGSACRASAAACPPILTISSKRPVVPDPIGDELEVVPDLTALVVATVRRPRGDGDIGPPFAAEVQGIDALAEGGNAFIEVVVVVGADVDVDAAAEGGAQVLAPRAAVLAVRDALRVDLARDLVPRLERVPVQPLRAEDGVPDVPLQRGARGRAEDELPVVLLLDRREDVLGVVGGAGEVADRPDLGSVEVLVGVGVAVERDVLVLREGEGVRVRGEAGPEQVWARVEVRDQLVVEGVAVGTHIRRVDAVRVVVKGGLVPELDENELRCWACGSLIAAGDHAGVPGLGEGSGRVVERPLTTVPVALRVEHRVPCRFLLGRAVARGQQHGGPDVHVAAPKRAQLGAAHLDVLEQLRVGVVALLAPADLAARGGLDDGHVVETQGDGLLRADIAVCDFYINGGRHETPDTVDLRRAVAARELEIHDRPVAALGPVVRGEEGLHAVRPGRQLVHAHEGEAVDAAGPRRVGIPITARERDGVRGAEAEDVLAEHMVRRRRHVNVV
ncbi:hypothetical protein PG988_015960 [Apiospora saccharicola]